MLLTERHTIHRGQDMFSILDAEAFKSKNLYNATLYAVRQHFFENGKYLPYARLQKLFQDEGQSDYKSLPTKVAQWTMRMVDQNFRSFFKANARYKTDRSGFKARPRIPNYLDSENGRFMLVYTNQAISKRLCERDSIIKLSGIDICFRTRIAYRDIKQVRVVPRTDMYVIEVVYEKQEQQILSDNGRYCAIDLGVSNFATVTSNVKGFRPYVISGKKIKSYNRYWNKTIGACKSILEKRNSGKYTSRKIRRITQKRNNKVKDFMHKASRLVVNQLVSDNISTLIVGRNTGWKQDTNIGDVNNQNFVEIPYNMFVSYLKYKCSMAGITVELVDESYTSKCSFLDSEDICHHDRYLGKRKHRGLFVSNNGVTVNADVNGSYNILRKGKPKAFDADGVVGALVHPTVIRTV